MAIKHSDISWGDIRSTLADMDRVGLLMLVEDLYFASPENQSLVHALLNLGNDPLQPYKDSISRWLCPDSKLREIHALTKAKNVISDYKKAIGHADGVAELMVFYCEQVFVGLASNGAGDEAYFASLTLMFEQALKALLALPESQREKLLLRLDGVRQAGRNVGYGVSDDFNWLWGNAGLDIRS